MLFIHRVLNTLKVTIISLTYLSMTITFYLWIRVKKVSITFYPWIIFKHLSFPCPPTYERDNGQDKVEGGVHPQDVDVQVHRVQPELVSLAVYHSTVVLVEKYSRGCTP